MEFEGDEDGWDARAAVARVASGVVAVPMVVGFVVLGAAVVLGRTLRDVALGPWEDGSETDAQVDHRGDEVVDRRRDA